MAQFIQTEIHQPILRLQAFLDQCFPYHTLKHQAGTEDSLLTMGDIVRHVFIETEFDVIGKALPAVLKEGVCCRVALEQAVEFDAEDIGIFRDIFDIHLGHAGEGVFEAGAVIDDGVYITLALTGKFVQYGVVEGLFGIEMAVEYGGAHVYRAGDLVDGDAMKSFMSKKALSGREYGLPTLRA